MARFEIAILNDTLIKRATREIMWTPQKTADGLQSGYALGWGTSVRDGVFEVGHNGSQQGTSTSIRIAPEKRDGVPWCSINMDEVDAGELADQLFKIALTGASAPAPKN